MMSTRREFMAGTVAAGGALWVDAPLNAATLAATEPQLLVIDYELGDAHRLASEASRAGCRTVAVSGDRVRFARDVFRPDAPDVIGGITTYADSIVLIGCAEEAGYRVLSERHARGACVRWKVARSSR